MKLNNKSIKTSSTSLTELGELDKSFVLLKGVNKQGKIKILTINFYTYPGMDSKTGLSYEIWNNNECEDPGSIYDLDQAIWLYNSF